MDYDTFKLIHSELIMSVQYIEQDLKLIYSMLKGGAFQDNYSFVENSPLGKILKSLHELDQELGYSKIKEKDYELLNEIREIGKKKKEEYRTLTIKSEQTLTAEQLKVLIEKSHGTKIYLYILFAGLMGLRKSEILGLKYSDIDYSRQTIHVQRQLGTDLSKDQDQLPPKTKTKQEIHLKTKSSDRVLDMPDLVFNAVMEQRKRYEANRRRRPNDFQDLDYICCSSYGRPQSAAYVFQEFKRLLKESGLPDIRFHDLRHTYATLLMKDDIDVKAISNSLGHAKTLITVDVYGDKQEIISDCVDDIQVFIDEMIDDEDQHRNKDDHGQDNTFTDPDEEFSEDLISELTEQNKPISA